MFEHQVPLTRCCWQVLKPARRPRKQLVSFAGGFLFWQDPGGLRSEMRDMFQVRWNDLLDSL